MLTLDWFFRQAWRRAAGMPEECVPTRRPDLPQLRKTQWSDDFEQLMRNRLPMGAFRYGTFEEQSAIRHDNLGSIEQHLAAYRTSGNAEHLVDIANLALVEFRLPSNPRFHFASIDDGGHHAKRLA